MLHVEGEPVPLSPGIDLTAYRIVQESVTNALKHAGDAHVTVTLDYKPAELAIRVADDGRRGRRPTARATAWSACASGSSSSAAGSTPAAPRRRVPVDAVLPLPEGGAT